MKRLRQTCLLAILLGVCCTAPADTYKCVLGGKAVYADLPCDSGANRVDRHSDSVSRDQRYQAEIVNAKNRRQLSELEYNAARDRSIRGSVNVIDSMQTPETSSSRYGRR